ncbi:MAG TPA: FAD-dependent thymidylate synthase, partial [Rubrobacter sp.]|nr:FAD-dependent thymidylate synthase [Rubrobacter sp.]
METTERSAARAEELFRGLGGAVQEGFPAIHAPVYSTAAGTAYLKTPGVVVLAKPQTNVAGLGGFLEGFDPDLGFPGYLDDPTELPDSSQLCKTAGQLCYASFGPRRTTNENAASYFGRLTGAGHGSVLEHANFSFLLYGISRSVTHELVRHRAGAGFSQISQRYVSGAVLRFVERPEYQED